MDPAKRLLRSDAVRRLACWLIQLYIRLVFATGRWTIEGAEIPRQMRRDGKPFILAFWHGRQVGHCLAVHDWPRTLAGTF
jgi:lysophospholipid acyltransferase (LPLAT)-like uncharacterized protein